MNQCNVYDLTELYIYMNTLEEIIVPILLKCKRRASQRPRNQAIYHIYNSVNNMIIIRMDSIIFQKGSNMNEFQVPFI